MMKSRSEIRHLTVYDVSDFERFEYVSSSKGNVTKYTNGDLWIKTDLFGYESLAEVISSRVIAGLGFDTVVYNPCFLAINDYDAISACASVNFVSSGAEELNLGRMLQQYGSFPNSDTMFNKFNSYSNPEQRLTWVLATLESLGIREWLLHALAECIWLDSIILNEDRHLYNLSLLRGSNGTYSFINFDYGGALLSDLTDYSMRMPIQTAIHKVKSKPFSRHFSRQLAIFQPYLPQFNGHTLMLYVEDLYDYFEAGYIARCLDVLGYTLESKGIYLNIASHETMNFFK